VTQRSGKNSSVPKRYPSHPRAGRVSAPVGQARVHGMSEQATQGWLRGSIDGVPAARPAPVGSGTIAWTGQTGSQGPQRGDAGGDAPPGRAPGGRGEGGWAVRCSV